MELFKRLPWLLPAGIVTISFLLGLIFQKVISVEIIRILRNVGWAAGRVIVVSIRGMIILWFTLVGIAISIQA